MAWTSTLFPPEENMLFTAQAQGSHLFSQSPSMVKLGEAKDESWTVSPEEVEGGTNSDVDACTKDLYNLHIYLYTVYKSLSFQPYPFPHPIT